MKYFFKFLMLSGILFIFGCKETTVTSSGTPGDIAGHVQLGDTLFQNLDDNSGVKVSLMGTPYWALSDAKGQWDIQNVPPGTYTIFFSKEGYSSMKTFNLQFIGNGTYYYTYNSQFPYQLVTLFQVPTLFPNLVLRPFEDSVIITHTSYTDSLGYGHNINDTTILKNDNAVFSSRSLYSYHGLDTWTMTYFGKTKEFDPIDAHTFLFSELGFSPYGDSSGIISININRMDLLKAGFSPGETVYCSTYESTTFSGWIRDWYDLEFNQYIYSGFSLNHSEVKSFILP